MRTQCLALHTLIATRKKYTPCALAAHCLASYLLHPRLATDALMARPLRRLVRYRLRDPASGIVLPLHFLVSVRPMVPFEVELGDAPLRPANLVEAVSLAPAAGGR